jgi:hypothetical protein
MVQKALKINNVDLANKVRLGLKRRGIEYADMIPKATAGDIRSTMDAIKSFDPQWNDFINVLQNDILLTIFRNNDYNNPLKMFKRDGLYTEGSWIQEIALGLLTAHQYEKEATNVFGLEEPDYHVNYHRQNSRLKWKVSISPDMVEQAMYGGDDMGGARMVNTVLAQPLNSSEWADYLQMRHLFSEYQNADGFYNIQVADLASLTTGAEKASEGGKIAEIIRALNLDINGFYRTKYNPEGVPTVTRRTVLFGTPKFYASFDVNVLSAAFNMDRTNFTANRQVVVDDFEMPGTQCILADEDLFVSANTKMKTASIYDPENDVTNQWLHRWGIYSMSRFVNAIRLSTDPSTNETITVSSVDAVTVAFATVGGATPEFADKAEKTRMSATVTGDNPSQAVTWDIIGTSGVPKSTNTYIQGDGNLWIASDEQNSWLIIRAQSIQDPTKSATIKVGIGVKAPDASTVTGIELAGAESIKAGGSATYTATVTGDDSNRVVWAIVWAGAGVSIDQNGVVTTTADAQAGTATIVATSQLNPTVSAVKNVSITV